MKHPICVACLLVGLGLLLLMPGRVVRASEPVPCPLPTVGALQALPADCPSLQVILAKVRTDMLRLSSYHANLTCVMAGVLTRTEIWRQGDVLALAMDVFSEGSSRRTRVVFDRTWQHVEITDPPRKGCPAVVRVLQADRARSSLPGRPFDTFYPLRGTGLVAGEDVLTTVLSLMEVYRYRLTGMRDFGGEPCFELVGLLDPEAGRKRCRALLRPAPAVFLDSSTWLLVSRASGRVRGWGSRQAPDSPVPLQVVQADWSDARPPAGVFTYIPPHGVVPQDITRTLVMDRLAEAIGQLDAVEFLMGRDPTLLQARYAEGRTILHLASAAGDDSVVSWLLSHSPDANVRDGSDATPLHEACRAGNIPAVRALVCGGADVKATDRTGTTPLHLVAASTRKGMAEEVLPLLVEAGARVNGQDSQGRTPLHLAAAHGAPVSTVRALLGAGARRDLRDKKGKLPADLALTPEVRKLLAP